MENNDNRAMSTEGAEVPRETPEKKWLKIRSTQEILDNRYARIKALESELAAAKESLKELLIIAERYESTDLYPEDQSIIDRAKKLLNS